MLEEIYSKDKSEEIKKLLVNTLTELGIERSFDEQYYGAAAALGRAKELSPEDETVIELFNTARELSALEPLETEQETEKINPADVFPAQSSAERPISILLGVLKKLEARLRKIEECLKIMEERLEKLK